MEIDVQVQEDGEEIFYQMKKKVYKKIIKKRKFLLLLE